MALIDEKLIPELWSTALMDQLKKSMVFDAYAKTGTPKRDKFSQMLRDKALGRPEFPEKQNMTATEIRYAQDHWADAAGYAMANAIDRDILNIARNKQRR